MSKLANNRYLLLGFYRKFFYMAMVNGIECSEENIPQRILIPQLDKPTMEKPKTPKLREKSREKNRTHSSIQLDASLQLHKQASAASETLITRYPIVLLKYFIKPNKERNSSSG
ncbi:hypothetical protein HS088_TW02G01005 [Tripterygium wilfordii]|uniref:Uncharacterized protein n=1 Tax=Tripterygium wilfordii TaxID=458696 RepID=A0A7J7E103_TRIWF|nr:hypothetical protein HS088_TW02G01005 [Tripterygium wilfordii]